MMRILALFATIAAFAAAPAAAVVVADSLPYFGNPQWSEFSTGGGATITPDGGAARIIATNNFGAWFGWSPGFNTPLWSIADNSAGNYLTLNTRLSDGADDWQAYLLDGERRAQIDFNYTGCNPFPPLGTNCYAFNGAPGVTLQFAGTSTYVPLDTTLNFTAELLLRGSTVIYRINGTRYAGTAAVADTGVGELLIGDQTGNSPSGTGSMYINAVSFDSETALLDLPTINAVPEPAAWAMLIAGFGLVGAQQRRRRKPVFA